MGKLSSLTGLDLGGNQLTGTIPSELGNLSSLTGLDLGGNQLTGPIPSELADLSNLRSLNLAGNQLTGPIPPELGNLSNLRSLNLAGNQLTGPIPPELGNLASLTALNLAGNQLTGTIPQSFTHLTLRYFYFHGNLGLSVPDDAAVREWLDGIAELRDQDYSPASPFVPVILSSAGQNNSFFTSELTVTNRGTVWAIMDFTYTAHRGGGSGVADVRLRPGQQRIIPNAIDYLRARRVPIPDTGNRIGTLRVSLRGFSSSQVGVTVRTTTTVPEGRAGVAYPGVSAEAGFDEAVYLCGLRQNQQDRSNVAFQNMGTAADGPITLRTTVFSGDPDDSRPRVLEDVELEPGGFYQYSELLGVLDSVGGNRQGYVKVERVEGTAPFYAYGVINDQSNSDGSFVFPATASSLMGTTGQTLPVIVETGVFTSELMVTNFSDVTKTVTFRLRAGSRPDSRQNGHSGMDLPSRPASDCPQHRGHGAQAGSGRGRSVRTDLCRGTVRHRGRGGHERDCDRSPHQLLRRPRRAVRGLLQRGALRGGVPGRRLGGGSPAERGEPQQPGAGQHR